MILDTNALSAFADGDPDIGELLGKQRKLFIPVIVLGEFRYGISLSTFRKRYETWLDGALSQCQVLPIVSETTLRYADLRLELRKKGRPLPVNDVWIAALALQHGLPILTRDSHFEAIGGVKAIDW